MPTLALQDRGVVLAYEESGAPANSTTYTTVFLLHTFLFDARMYIRGLPLRAHLLDCSMISPGSFRRMFLHAATHNLRLIALHLREYGDSTKFTDEELDNFYSADPAVQEASVFGQGMEIASFIAHFIEHEELPPPKESNGGQTGGISILGWSAQGAASALSLLANIAALNLHRSALIEEYLRTVILLGVCNILHRQHATNALL